MSETMFTHTARITEEYAQQYPAVSRLPMHDATRLEQLTDLINSTGRTSLEGEPIYADSEWNHFHAFTHDVIIPEVSNKLASTQQHLDVLYDDCTVASTPYRVEYYLAKIANTQSAALQLRTNNESAMLERGSEWVAKLQESGQASQRGGVSRLLGERPVALTTSSGRPSCAVLDAVYQMQKAESGDETAILVHNTSFRGQQLDMQTVLRTVNDGMPFQNLANIYVRHRKGALRLAAIHVINAAGELTEVK